MMAPSKVYFTDLRTPHGESLLHKLERLMKKAGFESIDMKDRFVAIKLHFGEMGNLAFLRPNYARVVADMVKTLGGKPFLTDCNTLYTGSRRNALDHLDTAYANGFSPLTTGCQVIIADGLLGDDEMIVPIDGDYVKEAKIGRAVMEADVFISLSHFKGHEGTGFGGAIKNIGMGCGSRAGKKEQHEAGKPHVSQVECVGCGLCQKACAHDAITILNRKAGIDHSKCVGCGRCLHACPQHAVKEASDDANQLLSRKMAEYALAVVKDRPHFHVSLVMDISPVCDCYGSNDVPILPDVGMFASFDPVALDQACADACLRQEPMPHSHLTEVEHNHGDHFRNNHPETDWRDQLAHAEKMGVGVRDYELIVVK